jgi:hypothetical protein
VNGYDNETQDMAHVALSEALSVRISEMEKDPDYIEMALNEIDCDLTDALMTIRVNAHLTGNYQAYYAYEAARVSQYLTKYAKNEIERGRATRCASGADMFANWLHHGATDKFSGSED